MAKHSPHSNDQSSVLAVEMRGRCIRGGAATLLAQGGRFVLTLGSGAILARLLTPADFGVLAIAFAIVSFGDMLSQLGLSTATIQRASVNHAQINALFWLNMVLGVSAWTLLLIAAPLIGRFYGNSQVVAISRALGLMFILGALAAQHRALLAREMRFVTLAVIETMALAIGIAVGIVAAWKQMGCWALVMMYLARDTSTTLGLWWCSRWRPGWPAACPELNSLVRFGANCTAAQLVGNLARQCDSLLLGWWCGPYALGLYSKAYQLATLPNQLLDIPLTRVLVPTLSRLQGDAARYRSYYRSGVMLLAALEMPIVAFVFVDAKDVIGAFLGSQWLSATPLLRILAIAAFTWPLSGAMNWAFVSLGRVNRQLRWETFSSAIMIAGFLVGMRWGTIGMAVAFVAIFVGWRLSYAGMRYCLKGAPVTAIEVYAVVGLPAVASVAAALLWWVVRPLWGSERGVLWLPVDAMVFALLYLIVWLAFADGRAKLGIALRELRDLRSFSRLGSAGALAQQAKSRTTVARSNLAAATQEQ